MKRYDLSKIMKRTHNLYNNARAKYPTFSEARKQGISYDEYQNRLSRAMGYGCGMYCGD